MSIVTRTKKAFSSWDDFKNANSHMDPTPKEERTWKWYNFGGVWFSYAWSPGVWALGSSMIKAGLTPAQAVVCIFLAHLFGAVMIVFNSRFGAVYHMGFPVYARISFGMWGSFFAVLLRCALGILWVGVLTYQGGWYTNIMLRATFGHKWMDIENTLPASSGTNSRLVLSAMIFWIITVPATYLPMHKTRHFWTVKAFVLPPCVMGLFIYTQVLKGSDASDGQMFPNMKRVHGAELSWTMLAMINSAMGKTSSLQANQPDIARYAYNRSAPAWSQLIILPTFNTAVLGIFATSSVYKHWGVAYWNSFDLLHAVLDHNWNAGARCGVFLCALGWALSCFVSNIAANVLPFGADISALFPRYLSINRGQLFAYCLGIAMVPWKILASADSFLAFLGAYSVFFGPLAGISAVDYFYSRRGNVDVLACYNGDRNALYMYNYGFSWRAFFAYICGLAPTLPGLAAALGNTVPVGATNLFKFGWLFSICTSSLVYFVITFFFPHRNMVEPRKDRFEKWADDQVALLDREVDPADKAGCSTPSDEKDLEATADVLPVKMA
ncbi:hypothetical protein JCM10207_005757 [Rhodosporidiobolus poonsookiae]